MSPSAYYAETDLMPVAVRIYAERAPSANAKFDIFDDGVSIFTNTAAQLWNSSGVQIANAADTTIGLAAGQATEELAERFTDTIIDAGSWVYATIPTSGGGKNFTVILELEAIESMDSSD